MAKKRGFFSGLSEKIESGAKSLRSGNKKLRKNIKKFKRSETAALIGELGAGITQTSANMYGVSGSRKKRANDIFRYI